MIRLFLSALLFFAFSFLSVSAQAVTFDAGDSVRVYVLDEGLGLLSGPGLQYRLVETLPSGTRLEVLGGPSSDGTYVWWNVRAPSGNEGWSVEAADGIQTLVPVSVAESENAEVISVFEDVGAWGISNVVWSPDDRRVVVNTSNYYALLIDVENGEIIVTIPFGESVLSGEPDTFWSVYPHIQWSNDGQYILISDGDWQTGEVLSSLVLDGETGIVIEDIAQDSVTWMIEKISVLPPLIDCSEPCFRDGRRMIMDSSAGTLTDDNPAIFTAPDGVSYALGNAEGGFLWYQGSNLAVLWSEMDFDNAGTSTAEVWDLETRTRLARVPHNAINNFAGAPFPDAAFLSHDETKLAAAVMDPEGSSYTLTFYQLLPSQIANATAVIVTVAAPVLDLPRPVDANISLTVGGEAVVFTLDAGLKLRDGTSTSANVQETKPSRTGVTLLEGPVSANGYVWWHVQSPTGRDGWSVEGVDGITTLVPQNGASACIAVAIEDLTVYRGPGAEFEIAGTLPAGTGYAAFGATIRGPGFFWYQLENDIWAFYQEVSLQGNCDNLPDPT